MCKVVLSVSFLVSMSLCTSAAWEQDDKGWKYNTSDSGKKRYVRSEIKEIDGVKYGFNEEAYMVTGWYNFPDSNEYENTDEEMYIYQAHWYYFDETGALVTDNLLDERYINISLGEYDRLYKYAYWYFIHIQDAKLRFDYDLDADVCELGTDSIENYMSMLRDCINDFNRLPKPESQGDVMYYTCARHYSKKSEEMLNELNKLYQAEKNKPKLKNSKMRKDIFSKVYDIDTVREVSYSMLSFEGATDDILYDNLYKVRWDKDDKGLKCFDKLREEYLEDDVFIIESNLYAFDEKGYLKTGWVPMGDNWVYLDENGNHVKDSLDWKGKTYHFDKYNGLCLNPTGAKISYEDEDIRTSVSISYLVNILLKSASLGTLDSGIYDYDHRVFLLKEAEDLREISAYMYNNIEIFSKTILDSEFYKEAENIEESKGLRNYIKSINEYAIAARNLLVYMEADQVNLDRMLQFYEEYIAKLHKMEGYW